MDDDALTQQEAKRMTRAEFRKRLGQLREVISRALAYYTMWKTLMFNEPGKAAWSLEEQNAVLGRFRGFFTPVAFALLDMALLEFAKIFDSHAGTASLRMLLSAARRQRDLVPHRTPEELRAVERDIKQSRTLLTALGRMRDQHLAHIDASSGERPTLLLKDMDELAESVKSAFNALSVGHDQNIIGWDFSLRTSESDTSAVLGTLLKEMERKTREGNEEMVRIGLEQVRRTEEELGVVLSAADIRSVIGRLGLTEEQMVRVEHAHRFRRKRAVREAP